MPFYYEQQFKKKKKNLSQVFAYRRDQKMKMEMNNIWNSQGERNAEK